ncbi:MAG TPA: Rieske (2Fe-2S) protein [Pseudoxanthomonas sp.]|nr:Rieske (2Fe-2S) protein [Pseudoxanthomonas sp.]
MTSLNDAPLVSLEAVPEGGLVAVEAMLGGAPESLVLHRAGGGVRAWLNVCPHAGRRLDWAPGQFLLSREGLLVCAAHGAAFDLGDGQCVSGPCRGDGLRAVAVEVRDGQVWLAGGA